MGMIILIKKILYKLKFFIEIIREKNFFKHKK